jgi:hypothetical protein
LDVRARPPHLDGEVVMRRPSFRQRNAVPSETPKPSTGQLFRLSSRGDRTPRRATTPLR